MTLCIRELLFDNFHSIRNTVVAILKSKVDENPSDDEESEGEEDASELPEGVNEAASAEPLEQKEAPVAIGDGNQEEQADEPSSAPAIKEPFVRLEPHELYSCDKLVDLMHHLCAHLPSDRHPVIGMVGYPNVSSCISMMRGSLHIIPL